MASEELNLNKTFNYNRQPGERRYITIQKYQKTSQKLIDDASKELKITQQMIKSIQQFISSVDKNIENQVLIDYLTQTYGEGGASDILAQIQQTQQSLKSQLEQIIKGGGDPKDPKA